MKELFYFQPRQYGINPDYVHNVHLIGEFNNWGQSLEKLELFKLREDKSGRWCGVFDVPAKMQLYKFLINKQTICPTMSFFTYSTVKTPDWAKNIFWYQIMTDRFFKGDNSRKVPNYTRWDSPPDYFNNFGGDLRGIKEKISYLKTLFGSLENVGLYLNPLHKSLASNHKYWPEDFEQIDLQFGTEEEFQELINTLHNEKARIIIDLVYNHTGLNHYAFLDILQNGKNSKYYDWYKELKQNDENKIEIPILEIYSKNKPQNLEIENDPRSTDFSPDKESFLSLWEGKYKFIINEPEKFKNATVEEIINAQPHYKLTNLHSTSSYKCWAGFFEIPELNTKNPEVKKHLFDSAKKWIKSGVDGFRLDVPDLLDDAHTFWREFREEIKKEMVLQNKNPNDLYIVGEIWTLEGLAPSYICAGEDGTPVRFDALMNYPIREAVLNFFSGEILNKASDSICKYDEISAEDLDKAIHKNLSGTCWETNQVQFNVFSSHDTRRLRTVLKEDKKLKAALIMQFTLPGAPVIYYGDEIGMTGGSDPANRASMRWDICENLSFYKNEEEIFNLYKNLINLRKNYSCLINAPVLTLKTCNYNKIYAYARYDNESDGAITVVINQNQPENINLGISGMPFENIKSWKNPLTDKVYTNSEKNIVINPEDFSESFGIVLIPN